MLTICFLGMLGRFSVIYCKEDNFCDFLFAVLKQEQIIFFKSRNFLRKEVNNFEIVI